MALAEPGQAQVSVRAAADHGHAVWHGRVLSDSPIWAALDSGVLLAAADRISADLDPAADAPRNG